MFDLLKCYQFLERLDPLITPPVNIPSQRPDAEVLTELEIVRRRLHDICNFIKLLDDNPNNLLHYRAKQVVHSLEIRRKELVGE